MDPIVLMQSKWGATFNIPWYLFLGGMSGGILIIAALLEIAAGDKPKFHALSGLSALLNLPLMIIGGLALTFHLGKPERGFFFPLYMTNYKSWLVLGGWVIGIFVLLSVAVAAAWYFDIKRKWRMVLALVSLPVGVVMCLYTGLLLSDVRFVPLWSGQFLPVLFLLSGLSTGLAVCAINAYVVNYLPIFPLHVRDRIRSANIQTTAPALAVWDIVVVALELVWLFLFVNTLQRGGIGHGSRQAAAMLTEGVLATWFWMGVIVLGMVLPLALSLLEPILKKIYNRDTGWAVGWPLFAKLHLVLLGGIILRYVIVWGGDMSQPLNFPPQMNQVPKISFQQQGSPQALTQALRQIQRR